MRNHRRAHALAIGTAGLALALAFALAPVTAQTAVPLLVDSSWLAQHLNDRDLVLLHVGTKDDYDAAHIPGARLVSEEDLSTPHDMAKMATELMLELPPVDQLRAKVASFGISDNSRIVVYSAPKTAVQSSTRIIFTLDYLGLGDRTSLLNGGIPAWTRAGKTTTTQTTTEHSGTLTARATKNVVTDAAGAHQQRASWRSATVIPPHKPSRNAPAAKGRELAANGIMDACLQTDCCCSVHAPIMTTSKDASRHIGESP